MFRTLIVLSVVFGLAVAEPLPKIYSSSSSVEARSSFGLESSRHHDYSSSYYNDDFSIVDLVLQPESTSLIAHVITSLIGYKISALSLAVSAIGWVIKNFFIILIGAITTYSSCKLTGSCTLDYHVPEPVAQFRSLVTPDRLATAERFLMKAIEQYAESGRHNSKTD